MNLHSFFIGIGPEKTGTGWLYEMLNQHPDVWMPPDKEIRYFWSQARLGPFRWYGNFTNRHWHFKTKRRYYKRALKTYMLNAISDRRLNFEKIRWDFNYVFKTPNDQWYLNLFPDDKLSGDITPLYSTLRPKEIEKIKELIPHAKVIISLRDPIEREWSRIQMNLNSRRAAIAKEQEPLLIEQKIKGGNRQKTNDYVALVKRWQSFFPENQILVYFFDEMVENPKGLLKKIYQFLGVPPYLDYDFSKKINPGKYQKIPVEQLKLLVEMNKSNLQKMKGFFKSEYPQKWHDKYV